jgi:hypothetical protein
MTRIVGIHGIAQQLRGPELLRGSWAPALRDGAALSGAEPPDEDELEIVFYGNLYMSCLRSCIEPTWCSSVRPAWLISRANSPVGISR